MIENEATLTSCLNLKPELPLTCCRCEKEPADLPKKATLPAMKEDTCRQHAADMHTAHSNFKKSFLPFPFLFKDFTNIACH
jgi:hypothetical protein